jgi:nicotinamidase/pyrazinamidase
MKFSFEPKDALLIVDVQIDFCPGGNLPIERGDEVVDKINPLIEQAQKQKAYILFSKDFHPNMHPSFKENGGPWPRHCLQGTKGAEFHPDLIIPENSIVILKGTRFDKDQYSAFDETGLKVLLEKLGIKRVIVAGLALDVCVKETALDSVKNGFKTYLFKDGTRAVSKESGDKAISLMKDKGIIIL